MNEETVERKEEAAEAVRAVAVRAVAATAAAAEEKERATGLRLGEKAGDEMQQRAAQKAAAATAGVAGVTLSAVKFVRRSPRGTATPTECGSGAVKKIFPVQANLGNACKIVSRRQERRAMLAQALPPPTLQHSP